jgi:hypothetical protein
MMTLLHQRARRFKTKSFDGFCRRLARLGAEGAAKLPSTETGNVGESLDGQVLSQVAFVL